MSDTTEFIAELIRAANEIGKLTAFEKQRLLERAVTTVRDMREEVGIPGMETLSDALIPIRITAATIERRSNDDAKAAMLEAAEMIRALKIVLDAKDEVLRGDQ